MKTRFQSLACFFALLLVSVPQIKGVGLILIDETSLNTVPTGARPVHRFTPLELRSVRVTAEIKDQVAETRIEQEFFNSTSRRLEGTFYLPLPKGAHLQKFAMEVNGKMTEAEVLSAEKAKSIYEEIVRKAQDPALLEYMGRDLVKVRIFPIEPHSSKRVEVAYTQLLALDSGMTSFVLPLSGARHCSSPIQKLAVDLRIESSSGLKAIYSPTHSPEIIRKSNKQARLGLELGNVRPEKDFQVYFSMDRGEVGMSLVAHRKPGEDGYFMLLAAPGISESRSEAKDVVFVMDTSGSMAGAKIDQARKALLFCINSLREDDRFEVIRFSTEAERMFGKLTAVSKENVAQAESFVRNLKATGGTAIHDALTTALKLRDASSDRPCYIVFVTDGLPTVGTTAEDLIVERVKKSSAQNLRVFCFGVGTDVNAHLLDKIAEETGAVSQYVLPDEDLEVKLSAFFAKISDPVLSNVEIEFEGFRASRVHPGKMPDLFKGQQAVLFGRYAKPGSGEVVLSGTVGGKRQTFRYKAEFVENCADHEFIPRLWATRRVGYLLDEIRLRGENAELKDETTALAKQYGMVTPYTSFLVREDAPISELAQLRPLSEPVRIGRESEVMKRHIAGGVQAPASQAAAMPVLKSGDSAVAAARYNAKLKEADNEALVQLAPVEVHRFALRGQLASVDAKDEASHSADQRYVGSRTFQKQDAVWVEVVVAQRDKSTSVRIEFNSREYWELASAHPELKDILSLGTDVQFVIGDKLFIVFSKK